MNPAAIFQLALVLLPLITTGLDQFLKFIAALRASLIQDKEWTPEQEAAYRAALAARGLDPAYQPDPRTPA